MKIYANNTFVRTRKLHRLKHSCSIFWFAESIIEAYFEHSWFVLEAYSNHLISNPTSSMSSNPTSHPASSPNLYQISPKTFYRTSPSLLLSPKHQTSLHTRFSPIILPNNSGNTTWFYCTQHSYPSFYPTFNPISHQTSQSTSFPTFHSTLCFYTATH